MRVAVLSDARLPTLPDGGHGLGMSAHSIATGLARRGHDVMLFAAPGSRFAGGILVECENEQKMATEAAPGRFDAFLDTSHQHHLSLANPMLPVLNRICDLECDWQPPNVVVNSPFMQARYGGSLVNTGLDVETIPFCSETDGYLAFVGDQRLHKGYPEAQAVAARAGRELRPVIGLRGAAKWNALGNAYAVLHPSTIDAAPRTPLEAAACGVPTLCLDGDGAAYHVEDGVSGFVCTSADEMVEILHAGRVSVLDRNKMRRWVAATHSNRQMIDGYEQLLVAVAGSKDYPSPETNETRDAVAFIDPALNHQGSSYGTY